MKKLILFLFLVSCSTTAQKDKQFLIREFNDDGQLISETVVQKYTLNFEKISFVRNGKKVEIEENFEIRLIEK